jgi:hypothetical protein
MKGRQSDKALKRKKMKMMSGGLLSGLRAVRKVKELREHPAVEKVKKFRRKLDFNNMMASGKYTKEQAAKEVGVNLRPGEELSAKDFARLSSEGELPKDNKGGI